MPSNIAYDVEMTLERKGAHGLPRKPPMVVSPLAKKYWDYIRKHAEFMTCPVDGFTLAQLCESLAELRRMSMPSSKKKPTLAQRMAMVNLLVKLGFTETARGKMARTTYGAKARKIKPEAPGKATKAKSRLLRSVA